MQELNVKFVFVNTEVTMFGEDEHVVGGHRMLKIRLGDNETGQSLMKKMKKGAKEYVKRYGEDIAFVFVGI